MKDQYTISELANAFDTTQRTVRFYEEKGILSPSRDSHGKRIYSKKDRIRLQLSLRGRRLGWSLDDICQIIHMYDTKGQGEVAQLQAAIERMRKTRETLLDQRNDIDMALSELDELESNCQQRLKSMKPE